MTTDPCLIDAVPEQRPQLSRSLLWTMCMASAVAVANIYYNQPMLADMMRTFNASARSIGLVATFTQVGYAVGMPAFIPLGDFIERRRLITLLLFAVAGALTFAATSTSLIAIVAASFLIGLTTVAAQIMIPLAAELVRREDQGRTIGAILSAILLGILLARTVSGTVAHHLGWRAMYWIAAALSLVFAVLLRIQLPRIPTRSEMSYGKLLRSIWQLVVEMPKLRQVSLVAGMFFAAFSVFWTTLIFLLETPPYHYGSQAAGLFGLVGATGAAIAPIAGRESDRRGPRRVVLYALIVGLAAYGVFWQIGTSLWGLIAGVILLDAAVQGAQVANQSRVLSLLPKARNRVNAVYMITYFGGGSVGSLVGSWAWEHWRWNGVCAVGSGFLLIGVIAFFARGPEEQLS